MNQCDECKEGQGGDDGMGGRVQALYGDPALRASRGLDPTVYGHVGQYEYKLKACSSLVIQRVSLSSGFFSSTSLRRAHLL